MPGTKYLERSCDIGGGSAFWTGFLRPITSFDEFSFLLALSIWSTFDVPAPIEMDVRAGSGKP